MDQESERRERAYKIWEDEGRPEGQHDDHWRRAEDQHEATEEQASEISDANRKASEEFNKGSKSGSAPDIRPPSTVAPD